ncbi:hypothetical protein F511_04251 [Dorcoceras hygrometricum]|nr:hypothetical protein F511_04251 [Dorcoceras hygrometricum]
MTSALMSSQSADGFQQMMLSAKEKRRRIVNSADDEDQQMEQRARGEATSCGDSADGLLVMTSSVTSSSRKNQQQEDVAMEIFSRREDSAASEGLRRTHLRRPLTSVLWLQEYARTLQSPTSDVPEVLDVVTARRLNYLATSIGAVCGKRRRRYKMPPKRARAQRSGKTVLRLSRSWMISEMMKISWIEVKKRRWSWNEEVQQELQLKNQQMRRGASFGMSCDDISLDVITFSRRS